MRPRNRLLCFLSKGICAFFTCSALLACSESSPSGPSGGAGANVHEGGAGGGSGGSGGGDSSTDGTSGHDGSGGAGGVGGSARDASNETSDSGAGGRDADSDGGGGRDTGVGGGGIDDASRESGGASGMGGGAGASGGVSDAATDGGIADSRVEPDRTNVDVSSGDSADTSTGRDGGDTTDIVAAGVRWFGRVDTTNGSAPRFSWSGTGFAAQFSGTSVGVDLQNDDTYFFQVVIDGAKGNRFQATKGRATQVVASGLAAGSHTLELYREIETYYGTSQFFGLTGATLQPPPPSRGRLLEFVGDSISAGYGNLGNEPHAQVQQPIACPFSFATESAYMSYGAVTARALNADASILAESGWGVYRDRAGGTDEVLPKVYDRTLGNSATPAWDFRTKPQAVVINLGTNDFNLGDPGNAYAQALGAFVDTVRGRYPAAWIFCAVGTMYSNAQHAQALSYTQSVVNARGGDAGKVVAVDLGVQDETKGTGCDWHPSVAEHQRMADVLVPVIRQKLAW